MGVFDIVGPVMIGPSSSHTAGAARLGRMARTILGEAPTEAAITLYGSFARTHKGHGTDKALVAGLLDLAADDPRLKEAFALAAQAGVAVSFSAAEDGDCHPNTAEFRLTGASGKKARVVGASVGGGSIVISKIDDFAVEITGEYHTLIAVYLDKPGVVALVTHILAQENVNIAFMRVSRKQKGAQALMILETDQPVPPAALGAINAIRMLDSALTIRPL